MAFHRSHDRRSPARNVTEHGFRGDPGAVFDRLPVAVKLARDGLAAGSFLQAHWATEHADSGGEVVDADGYCCMPAWQLAVGQAVIFCRDLLVVAHLMAEKRFGDRGVNLEFQISTTSVSVDDAKAISQDCDGLSYACGGLGQPFHFQIGLIRLMRCQARLVWMRQVKHVGDSTGGAKSCLLSTGSIHYGSYKRRHVIPIATGSKVVKQGGMGRLCFQVCHVKVTGYRGAVSQTRDDGRRGFNDEYAHSAVNIRYMIKLC